MKNPLSEIYSNQILLNEEKTKSPVVTTKGDIGKVGLIKGQGPEKKKEVENPKEDKNFSQGKEAKPMKESTKSYEGAFEKLFKATINEEQEESGSDIEVPTNNDDMMSELEQGDEDSDLMSDLRSVINNLQNILDKLSEEEGSEEENNLEEGNEEEGNEEGNEEENPYEESVSMEDKGHALHGMKAGTDLMSKGKYHVASKIKSSKGTAHKGELSDSPEPKELGDKKGPLMKKGIQANSSVKTGDFFK